MKERRAPDGSSHDPAPLRGTASMVALGLLTLSPRGRLSFWLSPALPLRSPSRQTLKSKGDLSLNFCADEVERGICWPRKEIFSSLTHADNRNLLNEELPFEHPSIPSCLGCGCP